MLSFVVIGRNEGWRLEKCLRAARQQAEKELSIPYEVIYVDSQSTDGSVVLSKKYADKTFLITGVCNAAIGRNIGAREAAGDILFFLDGDMELREGVLSSILNGKGQLHYPFVSGVEKDFLFDSDWTPRGERIRRAYTPGENIYQATTGGLFAIDRKLWEEMGGMDCRFFRSQDMELGFRLSARGLPLLRMGQLWVNHYTVFYAVRSHLLSTCRYSALLLRKHFLSRNVQKTVLKNNYSAYLLAASLVAVLCIGMPIGLLAMAPYLAVVGYRTYRVIKKTSVSLGILRTAANRGMRDLLFIWHFLTYYPSHPSFSYKEV